MKIPYFFKAKSRIGLKNKPIHQQELNLGVEEGSEAILQANFLASSQDYKLASFTFPNPEDIKEDQFNQVLSKSIQDFVRLLSSKQGDKSIQVIVGGDHSITFSSVLADIERIGDPKKIGVIHIDSHADINLSKDSPTGNFHGMYLRPLFDRFDIPEIELLAPQKIPTENLIMIGNLDLDPGETEFIERNQIKTYSAEDLASDTNINEIKSFINSFEHLHISFDIDSLDKTIAPATGIPA